jgi:hypothetical protein
MREIQLTTGGVAMIDDEDYARIARYSWRLNRKGRPVRTTHAGGRSICTEMHRFILEPPPGVRVDHIDGDPLNNQRANLRLATAAENSRNRRSLPGSSSRFKGVTWNRQCGKWQAGIKVSGRQIHLGLHVQEDAAARVYDRAAREHFGEFAYLNFPELVEAV